MFIRSIDSRLTSLMFIGTLAIAACGATATPDVHTVLNQAKNTFDQTQSMHLHLTSQNVAGSGPLLVGADGDVHRPDEFTGTVATQTDGLPLSLTVISFGGSVYAKFPFTSPFVKVDPRAYGFSDPTALLSPTNGVSSLIQLAIAPKYVGRDRINGEEVNEIDLTFPGVSVAQILTLANTSAAVPGRISITTDTAQVRRVTLTGPFFETTQNATFTLTLDQYGKVVSVTQPANVVP